MPIEWNGTEAPLLVARFEHEPPVGFPVAQPKSRLMALAPILRVAWRQATLAQPTPIHGLGNDFPDLPGHTLAIDVVTMSHGGA